MTWGKLGTSIKRSYPPVAPPPSWRPRYCSPDDEWGGEWREWRYFSPAFTGADVLLRLDATKTNASRVLFPSAFYAAAQAEVKQLVTRTPKSVASDDEKLSWLVHTAWCTYSMLMASNVYPELWSDALRFATNPSWIPPQYGWDMSLDWIAKEPTRPKANGAKLWTLTTNSLVPWFWFAFGGGNPGGMQRAFAYPRWWANDLDGDGSNPDYSPEGWLVFMPWANIFGHPKGKGFSTPDELKYIAAMDKDGSEGLQLLAWRAARFGGLMQARVVVNMLRADGTLDALIAYWQKLATFMGRVDYWKFVRGGVEAWKWRTVRLVYQLGEGQPEKQALAREDMRAYYVAHMDQRTLTRRAQAVGMALKVAKVFYKAISGDLIGTGKAYYDFAKWSKQQQRVSDANIPPDRLFFQASPLFIRCFDNAAYRPDVIDDQTATICDVDNVCTDGTGTAAMLVNVEKRTRKLEGLLETWLWEEPAAPPPKPKPVSIQPVAPAPVPTSSAWPKVFFSVCAAAAVSLFLWRKR